MGNSDHGTTYMRVGGTDGELRPWHYVYVDGIESRLMVRGPSLPVSLRCMAGGGGSAAGESPKSTPPLRAPSTCG